MFIYHKTTPLHRHRSLLNHFRKRLPIKSLLHDISSMLIMYLMLLILDFPHALCYTTPVAEALQAQKQSICSNTQTKVINREIHGYQHESSGCQYDFGACASGNSVTCAAYISARSTK